MFFVILFFDILLLFLYYGSILYYLRKTRVRLQPNEFIATLPEDLSPGIAHMMLSSAQYLKTIAIVIVSLAQKGFITIIDDSGDFIFVKNKPLDHTAFGDEKEVFNTLFDGRDEVLVNYHSYATIMMLRGAIHRSFITLTDQYYQGNKSFFISHAFISMLSIAIIFILPPILGLGLHSNFLVAITLLAVFLFIIVPFSNREHSKEGLLIFNLLQEIEDSDDYSVHRKIKSINKIAWAMVFGQEDVYYDVSSSQDFSWFKTQLSNEKYVAHMFGKGKRITPTITICNEMSHEDDVKEQNVHFVPWLSTQLEDVFRNSVKK